MLCVVQVLENRLFSEGLHVLGAPPSRSQMSQYLNAYFDGSLPAEALDAVAGAFICCFVCGPLIHLIQSPWHLKAPEMSLVYAFKRYISSVFSRSQMLRTLKPRVLAWRGASKLNQAMTVSMLACIALVCV